MKLSKRTTLDLYTERDCSEIYLEKLALRLFEKDSKSRVASFACLDTKIGLKCVNYWKHSSKIMYNRVT